MDLDRIERSIDIDASAEHVWQLVSEPGWWINDGSVTPHDLQTDGDVVTVTDPACGTFQLRIVQLDPPQYAAFRWLGGSNGPVAQDSPQSLVEFRITPRPGGITLTVTESGLSALDEDELGRRARFEENDAGWVSELAAARDHLMR